MKESIPVVLAAALIEDRKNMSLTGAMHVVVQEAVAMLIADLHRAGHVDAESLAARLEQTFALPEVTKVYPEARELAQVFAGRMRAARESPEGAQPLG